MSGEAEREKAGQPQGDLFGLGGGPLPPTTARIIKLANEIAERPPERPDYLHSVLCQVGLPRRQVAGDTFERTNGRASLLVEAGKLWNGKEWLQQPLPYGTRPRLALVHLSSEAVRTRSPTVEVGHSVREFLLRLEIGTGGEEYANFGRQMRALAACRMSLGVGLDTLDAKPIKRFSAWVNRSTKQRSLWPGVIELTPEFYESLADSAVPLDARALGALKHSALALDVYAWLAHRLHRVRTRAGTKVSWANLRAQFGQEYRDPKNFKQEMTKALRAVLAVYPDAHIEQVPGGMVLGLSQDWGSKRSRALSAMVFGERGCFVLDTGQHRPCCRLGQTWIEGPPRASKYLKLLRPPILRQSHLAARKPLFLFTPRP